VNDQPRGAARAKRFDPRLVVAHDAFRCVGQRGIIHAAGQRPQLWRYVARLDGEYHDVGRLAVNESIRIEQLLWIRVEVPQAHRRVDAPTCRGGAKHGHQRLDRE
jgi:hypothetical protein